MARVDVDFHGSSHGARRAADDTRKAIDQVERSTGRASRGSSVLGRTITNSLRSAISSALRLSGIVGGLSGGGLAGAVAFAGFRFNDLKQRAEIAFTTMLGGAGRARQMLEDLQRFALRTPFELSGLIKSSQQLLAMGFQGKELIPILTSVGNAVAALGGESERLDRVVLAIGQISAKGKLAAEEMRQLTEAGIPAWQMLADKIGKSIPEAMKLVERRQIDSSLAIAALMEGIDRRFSGMMEKQSRTFGGTLSNLKDMFSQISGTVTKPLFDSVTRGMKQLVDEQGNLTRTGERLGRVMATEVVPRLESAVRWIIAHRGEIAAVATAIGRVVAEAARQIATFVRFTRDAVEDITTTWKVVTQVGRASLIGLSMAWEGHATFIRGAMRAAGGTILTVMTGVVRGVLELLASVPGPMQDEFKTALNGLRSFTTDWIKLGQLEMAEGGRQMGSAWGAAFADLARQHMNAVLAEGRDKYQSAGTAGTGAERASAGLKGLFPEGTVSSVGGGPGAGTHAASDWQSGNAFDVFAKPGTKVLSPTDGTVVKVSGRDPALGTVAVGNKRIYGYAVTISGGSDATTFYLAHLDRVVVKAGQKVKRGQVIAYVAAWKGGSAHVHVAQPWGVTPGVGVSAAAATSGPADDSGAGSAAATVPVPDFDTAKKSDLIPKDLQLRLARAELTKGAADDLAVLRAIDAHLAKRAEVETDIDQKIAYLRELQSTREKIESLQAGGKDLADRSERQRARFGLRAVLRSVGELEPQFRRAIQSRAAQIGRDLDKVVSDSDMAKITRRVDKLKDDLAKRLELSSAIRATRAAAGEIAEAIGRMPAKVRADLEPQLAAVNAALGKVGGKPALDAVKSQLEEIRKAIAEAITAMERDVDRRRDVVGQAFDRVADKALRVFDARTDELLRMAEAKTADLDRLLRGETPEEAALRAFRDQQEAERRARERAAAMALTDPVERARRLRELDLADQERQLQERADASRKALEEDVELERERRAAAAEVERGRIRDERELLRERFQRRYSDILDMWRREELTAEEAQRRILELLGDPAWQTDFSQAGALVGAAFAEGFRGALAEVAEAIRALADAILELDRARGTTVAAADIVTGIAGVGDPHAAGGETALRRLIEGREQRLLRDLLGFQHGGKVPGMYLGRPDTLVSRLTPGETVIDRRLTRALEDAFVHGRGGGGTTYGPVYVLGATEDEVARALSRLARSVRIPSYTINDRP